MKLSMFATALFALSGIVAMAQNSATIQQRKYDQQARIAQGVHSGQLTRGETRNLRAREVSINREEHDMRRADNGRLTHGDRVELNRRQNRVSRSIYRDKHNGHLR
jgi:Ni/Co efflux regulator RcnB